MPFLPLDTLRSGASELGIHLSDEQIDLMDRFASLLVEKNKLFNLTRITEPMEIVSSHYLDSLTCLSAVKIKPGLSAIDIGTGAGFPGIPIKIARPDIHMTLLDSSLKKLRFIEDMVEELGMEGVRIIHARAEMIANNPVHREHYDIAFARALSEMKVLAELCLPLVNVGGSLIAQKSDTTDEEISAAKPIIGQLGGKIEKIIRVTIPGTDITRRIVVVSKIESTPVQFPRTYAKITQKKH